MRFKPELQPEGNTIADLQTHPVHIQTSRDGSHTLYSDQFGQNYHNPNGAVAESLHVFFDCTGIADRLKRNEPVHVLEVGFGTGLNFLLLYRMHRELESASPVRFTSIEGFPISPEKAAGLNYPDFLDFPEARAVLDTVFSGNHKPGLNRFEFGEHIRLDVHFGLYADFEKPDQPADVIFFDAFSPEANPELWTGDVFKFMYECAADNAFLTTYCASSAARAAMAWAGWSVARKRGALGKREMTLAATNPDMLEGLSRVNEARLAQRYANGEWS